MCVDAGVCGHPAARPVDVSVVSDRWSEDGGRFGMEEEEEEEALCV